MAVDAYSGFSRCWGLRGPGLKDGQQESSITFRDARHRGGIVCRSTFKGGSGVPDTGSPSIRVTSHTSFRPINSQTGKKEGGAGRDRKVKNGHKGGRIKGPWVLQSSTEGERVAGLRCGGSARLICPSFLWEMNQEWMKVWNIQRREERRTLSDVKQLQPWDANPGTEPLPKNAIPPPALIFIWSCGTLTFLRTSCRNRPPLMSPWCKFCITAWWLVTFRPPFTPFQISSRSWLPSVPRHSFKC